MFLISGNSHTKLAHSIAKELSAQLLIADTKIFDDTELEVKINKKLYKQNVVILQSTSRPVNDHLMELLFIADASKKAGAKNITAVIPYFGYSRQDKALLSCNQIPAALIARLIECSGIHKIITVDLHSKQSEDFFKIEVRNLNPSSLFSSLFKNRSEIVIVSPDIGGVLRARNFADQIGSKIAVINKIRNHDGKCFMSEIIGEVYDKNCVIIDDIVNTGDTLCKASMLLYKKGAKSVSACVTHGIFSGESIKNIDNAGFVELFVTDTIHHPQLPSFIKVISIKSLLIDSISV